LVWLLREIIGRNMVDIHPDDPVETQLACQKIYSEKRVVVNL
jgi:hypothetical protein